jgi:hypothetical protein
MSVIPTKETSISESGLFSGLIMQTSPNLVHSQEFGISKGGFSAKSELFFL